MTWNDNKQDPKSHTGTVSIRKIHISSRTFLPLSCTGTGWNKEHALAVHYTDDKNQGFQLICATTLMDSASTSTWRRCIEATLSELAEKRQPNPTVTLKQHTAMMQVRATTCRWAKCGGLVSICGVRQLGIRHELSRSVIRKAVRIEYDNLNRLEYDGSRIIHICPCGIEACII